MKCSLKSFIEILLQYHIDYTYRHTHTPNTGKSSTNTVFKAKKKKNERKGV